MGFTIPTEADWPDIMREGITALAEVRSGATTDAGPSGMIIADKWIRVHALRSPFSSGQISAADSAGYKQIMAGVGYFSEESQAFEVLWDANALSGLTWIQLTITYSDASVDILQLASVAAVRTVQLYAGFPLPSYIDGPFTVKVEIKNTLSNGNHFGLTLIETPLTSI